MHQLAQAMRYVDTTLVSSAQACLLHMQPVSRDGIWIASQCCTTGDDIHKLSRWQAFIQFQITDLAQSYTSNTPRFWENTSCVNLLLHIIINCPNLSHGVTGRVTCAFYNSEGLHISENTKCISISLTFSNDEA